MDALGHDDLPGRPHVGQVVHRFHVVHENRIVAPGQPFHQLGHLHPRPDLLGRGQPVIPTAVVGELESCLLLSAGLHHVVQRDGHPVHLQGLKGELRPLSGVDDHVGDQNLQSLDLLLGLGDLAVKVGLFPLNGLPGRGQLRRAPLKLILAGQQAVIFLL